MSPKDRIELVEGDITKQEVDAIVNAANESLRGGGGVDGAIHRAAGPDLLKECVQIGGCPTGEARITRGYRLPARHVIHTVGPIYRDGKGGEPKMLASAYQNSLALAEAHRLNSVAFPAISTGVYAYPLKSATEIAIGTTLEWLERHEYPKTVVFVLFRPGDREIYRKTLERLG
jgi:O-acetyl-ADP-ribose deacetylase (regulator of RNase III)